jgi:hypothetical protein
MRERLAQHTQGFRELSRRTVRRTQFSSFDLMVLARWPRDLR